MKFAKRVGCAVLAGVLLAMSGCTAKTGKNVDVDLSKDVSFPLSDKMEFSYWCVNDATGVV